MASCTQVREREGGEGGGKKKDERGDQFLENTFVFQSWGLKLKQEVRKHMFFPVLDLKGQRLRKQIGFYKGGLER